MIANAGRETLAAMAKELPWPAFVVSQRRFPWQIPVLEKQPV